MCFRNIHKFEFKLILFNKFEGSELKTLEDEKRK